MTRIEIEGLPIVTYSARAGMTPEELSWFVDDTVVRALQGVKGVSQIERFGGVDREIHSADPDRLLARHHRRRRQPAAARHQCRPGRRARRDWRARAGGRTLAGKQSVEDLAATMIVLPRGRKVRSTSWAP